jgi:hypothetical protein
MHGTTTTTMCQGNVRVGEFVFSSPRPFYSFEEGRGTECFGHMFSEEELSQRPNHWSFEKRSLVFGLWSLVFGSKRCDSMVSLKSEDLRPKTKGRLFK